MIFKLFLIYLQSIYIFALLHRFSSTRGGSIWLYGNKSPCYIFFERRNLNGVQKREV